MPFVVAVFADFVTGDYWIILLLLFGFFIPGVLIVFLCAWPYLLGDTFNVQLLRVGMQVLYPIGSGGIDTICDIFGAKQFHPIQHSDRLSSYFIWATVMLAVGGVTAELVYSMIANFKVLASFGSMLVCLTLASALFVFGTKRYIVRKINQKDNLATARAALESTFCWKKKSDDDKMVLCPPGFAKVKESNGGKIRDDLVTAALRLLLIIPVQGFFIPFNVALQQMSNTLIPMSFAMNHPKYWTGSNMVFANSSTVFVLGIVSNKYIYPSLQKRNIYLSTSHKICIGSIAWVLVYLSMVGVDHRIRRVYEETGEKISIGWQFIPYAIGSVGYIFGNPPQDELTYRLAPEEWKVLGNAINKFVQGGIANIIARSLYIRTEAWFTPSNGNDNINGVENYTSATSFKFMYVMAGFAALQALLCALPIINRLYKRIDSWTEAVVAQEHDQKHQEVDVVNIEND